MIRSSTPAPRFEHLVRMTTADGIFEHALLGHPRREHGYCLDDVSRALVVTIRQPNASPTLRGTVRAYLAFTEQAQDSSGAFRNRRRVDGSWSDAPTTDDHWGRALWSVGTTAALARGNIAIRAVAVAERAMRTRSPWPRAMAYAALGAAELLRAKPGHEAALLLLKDARHRLAVPGLTDSWRWPEPRLTYANAVLPEALIAIGVALEDHQALGQGLAQLEWLLELQTRDGHLSVIPAGGWAPPEPLPGFDQQPIEVAALTEACWRAHEVTGDPAWLNAVRLGASWFLGENDIGLRLYDHSTGGCADGLHAERTNRNQGAESTLAALSTLQIARRAALAEAA
ncbi:MAG: hypothetical protein WCF04_02330 [Candidatus Nanopelagicales bacterium]